MYNRLHLYLTKNNLLYNKEFDFQNGHSTDHAIVQLTDQIHEIFNKNKYILGLFIDLCKAFDTVNQKILLKKLSQYGIKNNSFDWFTCYLYNRKQFIGYNVNSKITFLDIVCGVPQRSILGPLLYLLYTIDLHQTSKLFADDTNLFYYGKNIHSLFNILRTKYEKAQVYYIELNFC